MFSYAQKQSQSGLAASLVRSLFCGLPRQEHRMAVFVCGLDESAGQHRRDNFIMGGFVAPEDDWSRIVAPAWEKRVLNGPPEIPYLHMTEIRSQKWRDAHDLSKSDADLRVDAAIDIIDNTDSLFPIALNLDGGVTMDTISDLRMVHPGVGIAPLAPDYVCFMGISYLVFQYVSKEYPEAEKVDFVIERNGRITKFIQVFHSGLASALTALGLPQAAKLVGDLIPAGKERVPLQAADVLCWHTARRRETMDELDRRRYGKLAARRGMNAELTPDQIRALGVSLTAT